MPQRGEEQRGPTDQPDRWWVTALGVAFATVVVIVLALVWPIAAAVVGGGLAVFAIAMWLNPRHWLKRRSSTCLGIAEAREYWTKARDLYAKLGAKHMADKMQAWLNALPPES